MAKKNSISNIRAQYILQNTAPSKIKAANLEIASDLERIIRDFHKKVKVEEPVSDTYIAQMVKALREEITTALRKS